MTTEIEDQLMVGMAEHSAGISLTADVLAAAKRRHAQRAARSRAAAAAAVLGVATVAAVIATKSVTPQGEQPRLAGTPPAVAAQSPELALAAAAAASDNITYQLKIIRDTDRDRSAVRVHTLNMEGAFDPATVTGYLLNTDGTLEYRLIAGTLYTRGGSGPFLRQEGTHEGLPVTGHLGESGLTTTDPQDLVASLRQVKAVITQTSASTYHYLIPTPPSPPSDTATLSVEGDITLDTNGRIAKVTCHVSSTLADGYKNTFRTTIELSGYGKPVEVATPANVR